VGYLKHWQAIGKQSASGWQAEERYKISL